jgi:hypothetical protein
MSSVSSAKYYRFDLTFGVGATSERVNSSVIRRLVSMFRQLDGDAPQEADIYSDGIKDFQWRKPPSEKEVINAIKELGFDFRYRFVHWGRDHDRLRNRTKNGECSQCDCYGPYEYGGLCPPVLVDSDWKIVKH